jgi:hypothetical protein
MGGTGETLANRSRLILLSAADLSDLARHGAYHPGARVRVGVRGRASRATYADFTASDLLGIDCDDLPEECERASALIFATDSGDIGSAPLPRERSVPVRHEPSEVRLGARFPRTVAVPDGRSDISRRYSIGTPR